MFSSVQGLGDARDSVGGGWMVEVVDVIEAGMDAAVDVADMGVGSVDVDALDTADSGVNGVNGVRMRGDSSERAERRADSMGVLPERKRVLCEERGVVAEFAAEFAAEGRREDPDREEDPWWWW